jgi:hypothetical protein
VVPDPGRVNLKDFIIIIIIIIIICSVGIVVSIVFDNLVKSFHPSAKDIPNMVNLQKFLWFAAVKSGEGMLLVTE